jgi:hypothetical protein
MILPPPMEIAASLSGRVCRVNLGYTPEPGIETELVADVPREFDVDPARHQGLLEDLIPEIAEQRALVPAIGSLYVDNDGPHAAGLFFTTDYYRECTEFALELLHLFAGFTSECFPAAGACGVTSTRLRTSILKYEFYLDESGKKDLGVYECSMTVTEDGHVTVGASNVIGGNRGTNPGLGQKIYISNEQRANAALADVYLWWAVRLRAYVLSGDVPLRLRPWYSLLAVLSARMGLVHVLEIAGLLLHELAHDRQSAHCRHCRACTRGYCCHDLLDRCFRNIMKGFIGLPKQQSIRNRRNSSFDSKFSDPWVFPDSDGCGTEFDGQQQLVMLFEHCSLLQPHPVFLSWSMDERCVPTGDRDSSTIWFLDSLFSCPTASTDDDDGGDGGGGIPPGVPPGGGKYPPKGGFVEIPSFGWPDGDSTWTVMLDGVVLL